MRRVLFLLLSAAALCPAAFAQDRPPKLEPLPEPPPPPTIRDGADDLRGVTIKPQEDKVEEVREGGRVVMMKVTPANGVPYYLIDTLGNGNFTRSDALDPGVRVPMWTIKSFD